MTEATQDVQPTPYEQLRDSVGPQLRDEWMRTDQQAERLNQSYERLLADDELTTEAKQRRAEQLFEQQGQQVAHKRKALRESLLRASKSAERSSIPVPGGEGLTSDDPAKLLASQNEAQRIIRTLERRAEKSPFGDQGHSDYLRSEYERGLELGGVEGGAIIRGALRASAEMGLGDGAGAEWLPRGERHHEALDRARRLLHAADSISTSPPPIPRGLSGSGRRSATHGLVASPDGQRVSKRKPAWK
jgi:hypothetical protein